MPQPGTARDERIRITLEHLRQGTTDELAEVVRFGPRDFTDPGIARRERERVFGRVPSIVAHASEVAAPGDTLRVVMPTHEVVLTRRDDGALAARGSGDDGPELPVEERHGLVWLVDGPGAEIDVAAWLGAGMDAVLAGYRLEDLVLYRGDGFDEPANWKLMQDAFIDNYHIQYAHPRTAAKHVHTNVQTVEDFGRHVRMCSPRKSIDRWLAEDPGDHDLALDVIDGHFLLPNSTLLRQPDDHYELLTFRPHPTDPGRCQMEMRLLVPTLEASGMTPERWTRLWEKNWAILVAVLLDEDFPILRGSQQALGSADAGDMLLGRNESVNQIFRRELGVLMA
jgi:phenylpropionate dioxygenase-like ring-hydroxylating dioxygenase large terminal subunit